MGCDPLDVEFFQGAADLAQLLLRTIEVMDGTECNLQQAGLIGVHRHGAPMLLQILTQLPKVLSVESCCTKHAVNCEMASSIIPIR
jgi:hypothetical protein